MCTSWNVATTNLKYLLSNHQFDNQKDGWSLARNWLRVIISYKTESFAQTFSWIRNEPTRRVFSFSVFRTWCSDCNSIWGSTGVLPHRLLAQQQLRMLFFQFAIDRQSNSSGTCREIGNNFVPNTQFQFVVLTSDDALTDYVYTTFYLPLLANRTNPDGNKISGTVFIPHEYTDYERVNDIYNAGFEVGVNSIRYFHSCFFKLVVPRMVFSKNALSSYWAEADVDTLVQEFGGARELVSYFANIPIETIRGSRVPNLQLNGNITFEAYSQSNLTYDHSWPTLSSLPFFPYTLDYRSTQDCSVGNCPNESFPGIWVLPIVNIRGENDTECNTLLGCQMS